MGLTIHYKLETNTSSPDDARKLVEQLRQKALDLPFKEVGEIIDLGGDEADFEKQSKDSAHRWLLIQAEGSVPKGGTYHRVKPSRIIAFSTWPGDGSEPANFGTGRLPENHRGSGKEASDRPCPVVVVFLLQNAVRFKPGMRRRRELPSLPPGRRRTPRSR